MAEGVDPRHQTFSYWYACSPIPHPPNDALYVLFPNCVQSARGLRSVEGWKPQLRKSGMFTHILWNQDHMKMPRQRLKTTMCKGRMVHLHLVISLEYFAFVLTTVLF